MNATETSFSASQFIYLIQVLQKTDFKVLGKFGCSLETVNLIMNLSTEELLQVAGRAEYFLSFSINEPNLLRMIDRAREHISQEKLIDDLLIWGATQSFIYKWFGLSPYDCKKRSEQLSFSPKRGRVMVRISGDIEEKIHEAWFSNESTREPYKQLLIAQQFNLTVSTIDALVRDGQKMDI